MRIRRAVPGDEEALRRVVNLAYRSPPGTGSAWTTEGHLIHGDRLTAAEATAKLANEALTVLVAEEDSILLGSVEVERADADGAACIGMLSVDPQRGGQGVGSQLFAAAEAVAWADPATALIELWALRKRDELIAWYARKGFRDSGRRAPFPVHLPVGQPVPEALAAYEGDFSFAILVKQRP